LANLVKEGVILEHSEVQVEHAELLHFVTLNVPFTIMCKWAQRLKMEMPLKLRDSFTSTDENDNQKSWFIDLWRKIFNCFWCSKAGNFDIG